MDCPTRKRSKQWRCSASTRRCSRSAPNSTGGASSPPSAKHASRSSRCRRSLHARRPRRRRQVRLPSGAGGGGGAGGGERAHARRGRRRRAVRLYAEPHGRATAAETQHLANEFKRAVGDIDRRIVTEVSRRWHPRARRGRSAEPLPCSCVSTSPSTRACSCRQPRRQPTARASWSERELAIEAVAQQARVGDAARRNSSLERSSAPRHKRVRAGCIGVKTPSVYPRGRCCFCHVMFSHVCGV